MKQNIADGVTRTLAARIEVDGNGNFLALLDEHENEIPIALWANDTSLLMPSGAVQNLATLDEAGAAQLLTMQASLTTLDTNKANTVHPHGVATTSSDGFMSAADKAKLDLLSTDTGASDAALRDRSTHTGTQPMSTISGLATALSLKADVAHPHDNATQGASGYMSASDKFKLDGIQAGATANASNGALRDRATHTGMQPMESITGLSDALNAKAAVDHSHSGATAAAPGFMSGADKQKLDGISIGATANATDSQLRERATHTGVQAISTVSGLQSALNAKAPLDSPTFFGTPTGPTPAPGDNSTKLATTAFVTAAVASGGGGGGASLGNAVPQALGVAAAGVSTNASREDHVHGLPTAAQIGADPAGSASAVNTSLVNHTNSTAHLSAADRTKFDGIAAGATANSTDAQLRDRATHTGTQATSTITGLDAALAAKAPLQDPIFTGNPKTTHPPAGDSSDRIPSTQFVMNAVSSIASSGSIPKMPSGMTAVSQMMQAFMALPFRVRAGLAVQGSMPFLEPIDLSEAVEVDLTDGADHAVAIGNALTKAAAITDPNKRVALLTRDATIVSAGFNIPDGVALVSTNGSKVQRTNGTGISTFNVRTGGKVVGIDFLNMRCQVTSTVASGELRRNVDHYIAGNRFRRTYGSGNSQFIAEDSSVSLRWGRIYWNEMNWSDLNPTGTSQYGMYFSTGEHMHIAFNRVAGPATTATQAHRGIFWDYGGSSDSVIEHNWISGVMVGIGQKVTRVNSRGSENNLIRWNLVQNAQEEGISFDAASNEGGNSVTYDRCTTTNPGYSGTRSSNPAIVVTRSNGITGLPSGYSPITGKSFFIIFLQGALTGKAFRVQSFADNGNGTVSFFLRPDSVTADELAQMANKHVSIQGGAYRNIVYANYLQNCRGSLVSWGASIECQWIGNVMDNPGNSSFPEALSLTTVSGAASTVAANGNLFSVGGCGDIVSGNKIVNPGAHAPYNRMRGQVYADPTGFIDQLPVFVDGNDNVLFSRWNNGQHDQGTLYGSLPVFKNVQTSPVSFSDSMLYNWQDAGHPHGRSTDTILRRRRTMKCRATANGSATSFSFPHGMRVPPSKRSATPMTSSAAAPFYVQADDTNISFTFAAGQAAPANGAVVEWYTEIEV